MAQPLLLFQRTYTIPAPMLGTSQLLITPAPEASENPLTYRNTLYSLKVDAIKIVYGSANCG